MFKKIAPAVAFALLASTSTFAADLPSRSAPVSPYVAPIFTWTGFYLGAHAGAGFGGEYKARTVVFDPPIEGKLSAGGFIIGGQAGFNYQMGSFVVGVEGDLSYADIKNDISFGVPGLASASVEASTDYLATIRGRIGYAWDRVFIYATGGVAFTKVELSASVNEPGSGDGISESKSHTGWTIGAGVEAALTDNISAKAEYLYVDFDDKTYFATPDFAGIRTDLDNHIIRVGVNYRFTL